MAIQSAANLMTSLSGGKVSRQTWQKQTGAAAYTAGRGYEMFSLAGFPVATAYAGSALAWVSTDATTGIGIPHGADVSAEIKHALYMSAMSTAATGVPNTLRLVDLIGYAPGIDMNSGSLQTLTGSPTLRTQNSTGVGNRFAMFARATTGSTAHNLAITYKNQANADQTVPGTIAATVSAIVPTCIHRGLAANQPGFDLPLAAGDTGARKVNTIQLSAASSSASTAVMLLYEPIFEIQLAITSLLTQQNLWDQLPSLPRINDGACLGFLLDAGANVAANTNFNGTLQTVWG